MKRTREESERVRKEAGHQQHAMQTLQLEVEELGKASAAQQQQVGPLQQQVGPLLSTCNYAAG